MKQIPVTYKPHTGAVRSCNYYKALTVLFMLLSIFLAFVALHNSQPLTCTDVVLDESNNIRYCEVPFNQDTMK